MQMSRVRVAFAGAVAVIVIMAACNESTAPAFELTVSNNPDDFIAQSVSVLNESLDREYAWQNSGTRATVTHATTVDGGIARIVIRDAANVVVYDRNLLSGLSEQTQVGTTGAWHIEILLSGFSGAVNVRVQTL
jgi:hypothetical protein